MKIFVFLATALAVTNQIRSTIAHKVCVEKGTDEFFLRTRRVDPTKPVFRSCAILATWPEKDEFCKNLKDSWTDGKGKVTGPPGEVCKITCGTCPTWHPTDSPSSAPSPSPEDLPCVNSPRKFKMANGVYPRCNQVKSIVRDIDRWCAKSPSASHCPKICGKCETYKCEDSQALFLEKGAMSNCGSLQDMTRRVRKRACRSKMFKNTCRKTCGYCEGEVVGKQYIIDFDEITIDNGYVDYDSHEESGMYFYRTVAFQRAHYEKDDIAFSKGTLSEPNAAGSRGYTKKGMYSEFFCPGGSFDLNSILITPLWNFNEKKANSITIKTYDDSGYDYVGEYTVYFDEATEVAKIDFDSNPSFENLGAVVIESPKNMYHGYDDIEIVVNTPCAKDYYADAAAGKAEVMMGAARQSDQEESSGNMWTNNRSSKSGKYSGSGPWD